MDLLLATNNPHKTREFAQLLGREFRVVDLSAHPEILIPPERGQTFAENARAKAINASKNVAGLVLADDSGLEVHALGGAPGISSARYAGADTDDGQNIGEIAS